MSIDRAVVISLARRPDRLKRFQASVNSVRSWPFPHAAVFPAIDGRELMPVDGWSFLGPGAWGCWRSHLLVLRQAVADGVNSIAIFEDDAAFKPDFGERYQELIDSLSHGWAVLHLGGQHSRPPVPVVPGVVRCTGTTRTHAYVLRGEVIRVLLNCLEHADGSQHLDNITARELAMWPDFAPAPFLVNQRGGYSDVAEALMPTRSWNDMSGDQKVMR